jgi:hypothetical protein
MILQFSVSNYRSFRKRQTLDFAASAQDSSLPANCIALDLPGTPKHWVKAVALYGPNASGKTSVLEALRALANMVTLSAKMTDPQDPIPQIEPFALRPGEPESPSAFEVVFVANEIRFAYRVAATQQRIWHESLRAYPTARAQTWFRRDWNPETKSYVWGPERPTGFTRDEHLERDTLSNMLFLSKHIASNRTELEPVFRWFKERLKFMQLDASGGLGNGFSLHQLREDTELKEGILCLLRHADLGVTKASTVKQAPDKRIYETLAMLADGPAKEALLKHLQAPTFEPQLQHRAPGQTEVSLPWNSESTGTHRLFALAGIWLDIIAKGHVVGIDELDTSLHPAIVMELLRLLFTTGNVASRAQIIFTTHNPLLLDTTLLRRDQVWFTEKDAEGEGRLYPLTDYAPRKEESLVRGYLSGRYGAVPFLPKGLLGERPAHEVVKPTKARNRKAKGGTVDE